MQETLLYSFQYVVSSALVFSFRYVSGHVPYPTRLYCHGEKKRRLFELWLSITDKGRNQHTCSGGEVSGHEGFPLIDLIEDRWGSHVTSKWPKWEEKRISRI